MNFYSAFQVRNQSEFQRLCQHKKLQAELHFQRFPRDIKLKRDNEHDHSLFHIEGQYYLSAGKQAYLSDGVKIGVCLDDAFNRFVVIKRYHAKPPNAFKETHAARRLGFFIASTVSRFSYSLKRKKGSETIKFKYYLLQRYLGENLLTLLQSNTLSLESRIHIGIELSLNLHELHQPRLNITHRNLMPEHILVDANGRVSFIHFLYSGSEGSVEKSSALWEHPLRYPYTPQQIHPFQSWRFWDTFLLKRILWNPLQPAASLLAAEAFEVNSAYFQVLQTRIGLNQPRLDSALLVAAHLIALKFQHPLASALNEEEAIRLTSLYHTYKNEPFEIQKYLYSLTHPKLKPIFHLSNVFKRSDILHLRLIQTLISLMSLSEIKTTIQLLCLQLHSEGIEVVMLPLLSYPKLCHMTYLYEHEDIMAVVSCYLKQCESILRTKLGLNISLLEQTREKQNGLIQRFFQNKEKPMLFQKNQCLFYYLDLEAIPYFSLNLDDDDALVFCIKLLNQGSNFQEIRNSICVFLIKNELLKRGFLTHTQDSLSSAQQSTYISTLSTWKNQQISFPDEATSNTIMAFQIRLLLEEKAFSANDLQGLLFSYQFSAEVKFKARFSAIAKNPSAFKKADILACFEHIHKWARLKLPLSIFLSGLKRHSDKQLSPEFYHQLLISPDYCSVENIVLTYCKIDYSLQSTLLNRHRNKIYECFHFSGADKLKVFALSVLFEPQLKFNLFHLDSYFLIGALVEYINQLLPEGLISEQAFSKEKAIKIQTALIYAYCYTEKQTNASFSRIINLPFSEQNRIVARFKGSRPEGALIQWLEGVLRPSLSDTSLGFFDANEALCAYSNIGVAGKPERAS